MLTLFTFGYWGWGNAVPQLIQIVDSVEASRGFAPPIFVDLRWHRSVRAKGFNGDALLHAIGESRYVWMRRLGNRKIVGRQNEEIEIAEPNAAADLLDLVMEHAAEKRRLIAFCACPLPFGEGEALCHRRTVADLVLHVATQRRLKLTVVEWPGWPLDDATPAATLDVTDAFVRSVARGRQIIPISESQAFDQFARLPWGGVLELRGANERLSVVSRPPMFSRGWHLRAESLPSTPGVAAAREVGARLSREHGFEPLDSPGPSTLSG